MTHQIRTTVPCDNRRHDTEVNQKMSESQLLAVEELHIHFPMRQGLVKAVNGATLDIRKGEILGLVGESGCGKSVLSLSLMRLVAKPGRIVRGRILLTRQDTDGTANVVNITSLSDRSNEIREIRKKDISLIFQEPMSSLSPVHTIGNQIIESIKLSDRTISTDAAKKRAIEMLDLVGIPKATTHVESYTFELSGGMRQRAMIAMALASAPTLLIADEPTTAVDVTIQAQIIDLIRKLQEEFQMSVLMVTHDLAVIATLANRIAVMYMGQVVETGTRHEIFNDPKHPYTIGLMSSIPRLNTPLGQRLSSITGSVPDPFQTVPGCVFHPRCDRFMPGRCDRTEPNGVEITPTHHVKCLLYRDRGDTPAC